MRRAHTALLWSLILASMLLSTAPAAAQKWRSEENPAEQATTVEQLVPLLAHEELGVRGLAAEKLASMPTLPVTVIEPLRTMIWRETDGQAALAGSVAFKRAGEAPAPLLLAILRAHLGETPDWVAEALQTFGSRELLEPALGDPQPYVRLIAAEAYSGIDRAKAMAAIAECYRQRYPSTRTLALGALVAAWLPEEIVVPAVIDGLRDPDPVVRREALDAVGRSHAIPLALVVPFVSCYASLCELAMRQPHHPAVLYLITPMFGLQGMPDRVAADPQAIFTALRPLLAQGAWLERTALGFLAGLGRATARRGQTPPEPMVSALIALLDDPQPALRWGAASALTGCGSSARDAAPRLGQLLLDPSDGVRRAAAGALGAMGPAASSAMPSILGAARSPDPQIRLVATSLLSDRDTRTPESITALAALLDDSATATNAAHACRDLRGAPDLVALIAPKLIACLDASSSTARDEIVESLGTLRVKEAVPALRLLLRSTPTGRREARTIVSLLQALGNIGDPTAIDDVRPLAASTNFEIREAALAALATMGDHSAGTVDGLAELLGAPECADRAARCDDLVALGPDAARAIPALESLLELADDHERACVASVLVLLGHRTPDAIEALHRLFPPPGPDGLLLSARRRDLDWRCLLPARALLTLGEAGPHVADQLATLLARGYYVEEADACEAMRLLTEIGCADDEVRDGLRRLVRSYSASDTEIAEEARKALAKLGLTE